MNRSVQYKNYKLKYIYTVILKYGIKVMGLEYSYKITQEQKLRLTDEMKLSIKVLEMPIEKLKDYINEEFERNPVLEVEENFSSDYMEEEKEEIRNIDHISNYELNNYSEENTEYISALNFVSKKKSLKEYLYEQIIEMNLDEEVFKVTCYLIENINKNGYLDINKDEVLEKFNDEKLVSKALICLEDLEPVGVGAQNLKQCLSIQIKHLTGDKEILYDIVQNYLEDIAKNNFKGISKKWKIKLKKAQEYGDIIKSLEPRPGRGFYTGEDINYIVPDAEIKKVNDEFVVILNDGFLPKIKISNTYSGLKKDEYIKEKIKEAYSFIRSIENRRTTLSKVILEIINMQQEYFDKGNKYLKPMSLKEMAEKMNLSQSTISRTIKDKYILTPYGLRKLRDLFTSTIHKNENQNKEVSVIEVKNVIKKLIDGEDKSKPISDQCICNMLNSNNINISRRTVAKYREELGINSSIKRKRI